MMRELLTQEARQMFLSMNRYLDSRWNGLPQHMYGDIIGDSFEELLLGIDRHEERYNALKREGAFEGSPLTFLKGLLRFIVWRQAIKEINRPRTKRTVSLEKRVEEELEGKIFTKPLGVTWPEQEDVVFKKQLLEHCAALPADERLLMDLAFDRATVDEMIMELGITKPELSARRASAMRRLVERAGPTQ